MCVLLSNQFKLAKEKSCSRQLQDGDSNPGFFHACTKSMFSRNVIKELYFGDGLLSYVPEAISPHIIHYFEYKLVLN